MLGLLSNLECNDFFIYICVCNAITTYERTGRPTEILWKSLAKDEDYRRRVELLQDFDFPTASSVVSMSPDGRYVIAAGTYPPQVRAAYYCRKLVLNSIPVTSTPPPMTLVRRECLR